MSTHQDSQKKVIDVIENQIKTDSLTSSIVSPIEDFEHDPRICLTSVHFPHEELVRSIEKSITLPLKYIEPDQFYYPMNSFHMTIKNIRLISNPPNFSDSDVQKVTKIFSDVIPSHKKFTVYFYRLLLFPFNLALIGTTDPEFDSIILDLDKRLKDTDIPDDKKYVNDSYFFSNMTLVRFTKPISDIFKEKVEELSRTIVFAPYIIDTVTLLSGPATLTSKKIYGTWNLQ